MKNSGIPWLGDIPSHWEIKRLQTQLYEINEKNSPVKTDFVLSLTNTRGVIPYTEKGDIGNKSKDNHEEYKIAYPDTIVANSMNILIGSVGICKYYGCVSPVYYILKEREGSDLKYFNYILSCVPFQKHLRQYANGILEIRLRLSCKDILQRSVPTPSIKEQQTIAEFLDRKCCEIDEMISLQERIIEELKAYKKSAITEAVCKGLNPNVHFKDSGIEWLNEIPSEWSVIRKLFYVCSKGISYGIIKLYEPDDTNGVKVLRCSDVREGFISENNIRTVSRELSEEYKRTILNGGEVVINVRGTLGGCAVVPYSMKGYNIAREVAVVEANSINNRYLMYYFLSNAFFNYQHYYLAGL